MVTGAATALTPWAGRFVPGIAPGVLEIGDPLDLSAPDPLRALLSLPDLPRRWLVPPAIPSPLLSPTAPEPR